MEQNIVKPDLTAAEKQSIGVHMVMTECVESFLTHKFGKEYLEFADEYVKNRVEFLRAAKEKEKTLGASESEATDSDKHPKKG